MIRAAISAALALGAFVSTAAAQDGGRWTHPSGIFSVAPEATGWAILPDLSDEQSTSFELIGEDRIVRMCFAASRVQEARNPPSQAFINERMQSYAPEISAGQISSAAMSELDGIAIRSFRLDFDNGGMVSFYRVFGVVQGNRITFNEVSCGGTLPISAEHQAAFERFLGSLRINAVAP